MAASPGRAAVVGAGIVGICCALRLRAEGWETALIDPREPGTATSFGNAGMISNGSITPYSWPGLWLQVPAMLFDPLSPLILRWRHLPRALPWLLRFLAAGRPASYRRITADMAPLVARAKAEHDDLVARHGVEAELVRADGYIHAFRDRKRFAGMALQREMLAEHGVKAEVLEADRLRELEPALSREFQVGLLVSGGGFVTEPVALSRAYLGAFEALGGERVKARATGFDATPAGPRAVLTDSGRVECDRVVLAAGAWSRPLARQLGARVPLEAKRGYHASVDPPDGPGLRRVVVVGDRDYTLCPMRDGLRVTAGVEFGGLSLPPDYRRLRAVLAHARTSLPGLDGAVRREWMGHRPALPDSKPVIGPSPRWPNVVFAFGHGHLGLTLSAVTARLAADLLAGRDPCVPLAPFRADRFGWTGRGMAM